MTDIHHFTLEVRDMNVPAAFFNADIIPAVLGWDKRVHDIKHKKYVLLLVVTKTIRDN